MNVTSFNQHHEVNSQLMLTNSQLLLDNTFQFNHPYDMEPCLDSVRFEHDIDWNHVPFGDEEWAYMLNRQEYLLDLCVSFEMTKDRLYLEKGKFFILDWISANSTSNMWRTIDTGIRLSYWKVMLDYLLMYDDIKVEEQERIKASVMTQLNYLDDAYIEKYHLSNWGVLITTGYFLIQQVFKDVASDESNERMLDRLSWQINLQVQSSGNHWEQSPLYFLEVLRSFVFLHVSGAVDASKVHQELEQVVLHMYQFMPHFVTPERTTILQGDTDEMLIDDMVQSIGILYNREIPELFTEHVSVDYMTLYLSGKRLDFEQWCHSLQLLTSTTFQQTMIDDETGNYYHHSSWDTLGDYIHVYNGALGSGHGHLSLGHIDVALKGMNVLVDSGRYTYVETPTRYELKQATAHNTCLINETPFGDIVDSWAYDHVPTSLYNRTYEDEDYLVIRTMHLDSQKLGCFKVARTVVYLKKMGDILLLDQVMPTDDSVFNKLTRPFHLSPHVDVSLKMGASCVEITKQATKSKVYGYVGDRNLTLIDTLYSPKYNVLWANQTLIAETTEKTSYLYLSDNKDVKISPLTVRKSDGKDVDTTNCYGLKIDIGEETHLFYSGIEDTFKGHKLYFLEDIPVYGQVGVVHKQMNTAKRLL